MSPRQLRQICRPLRVAYSSRPINTMTLKQTLENNIAIVVLTTAVAAFGAGWGGCELARVASKTEKIADLEKKTAEQSQQIKDSNVAIEPYQKQINELLLNTRRLETDLNNSQGNLTQWQQVLNSWKSANEKLQNDINLYASNCSVISLARAIEGKKEITERALANAYSWSSEVPKIEDYKRQVTEYQARLISLNEKLTCLSR
jgi:DNA repair exonuclease SbcCD ATPase subunit